MSQKSEFRFEFPKLGTEYTALVNSYHIEQAAAIIMAEHEADLCVVYFGDTLQFVCRYTDKPLPGENGFQFLYPDKSKFTSLHLLVGEDEISYYMEGGIDEVLKNMNLEDGYNIIRRDFYTTEEADAFEYGVDAVMSLLGREDEYAFISEDEYYKYRDYINNRNNQ